MRVTTLRGPASRIATIVWEEQCPRAAWRCLRCLQKAQGYIAQNHVLRDPSVARQKLSQVVGGVLKAQVGGGVAKVGRGLDRDLKRKWTKARILPTQWLRPALTSAVLAMVQSTLPDPSALPTGPLRCRQPPKEP